MPSMEARSKTACRMFDDQPEHRISEVVPLDVVILIDYRKERILLAEAHFEVAFK